MNNNKNSPCCFDIKNGFTAALYSYLKKLDCHIHWFLSKTKEIYGFSKIKEYLTLV